MGFAVYLFLLFVVIGNLAPDNSSLLLEKGKFKDISPEKTKISDIQEIYGAPVAIIDNNGSGSYSYDSAQEHHYDYIWYKGQAVLATQERIVQDITLEDFIKILGEPSLKLYDKDIIPAIWFIFPEEGVGLRTTDGKIYILMKFSPQDKGSFLKKVAPVVGLREKPIPDVEEVF